MRRVRRSHARPALAALLVASASCGSDHESGRTVNVYLPTAAPPGGDGGSGGSSSTGGNGGTMVEPHGPPVVTDMSPLSGPYGTEIRITGTDLGSSARADVTLTLGTAGEPVLTPTSMEVSTWSETQIRFRIPFPVVGEIVVTTPEGTDVAGEFTPTWNPGPALDSVPQAGLLAALASGPGRMAAVLNTGPPRFVEFDGETWQSTPISTTGLLATAIRLYLDENDALAAFTLTNEGPPRIAALDPTADFASTSTGIETAVEYAVTGGREGAAVWFRTATEWQRAAPTGGTWMVDRGPFGDSKTASPHHTAAATSDGALVVGWAQDTGNAIDDLGAVFTMMVPPAMDMFGAASKASVDVDDYITGLSFAERGSGVVGTYCGSDLDPFGITGSEFLCWAFLRAGNGGHIPRTVRESEFLRYTFDAGAAGVAYCSSTLGVRVVSTLPSAQLSADDFDPAPGETVAWPCDRIVAAEVDAEGETLLLIEHDGKLYSPRRSQ
jgi:IPT/TIG domain